MAESVDRLIALKLLEESWTKISVAPLPPEEIQDLIEEIMSANDITFKYILVTGYLAKCVNPKIHSRSLQAKSDLPGAYDARILGNRVVVGFEKSKGNLFGLSNEPFINNPARHAEHRGDNPQLRNKKLAAKLHLALELAQTSASDVVSLTLIHILRLGKVASEREFQVACQTSATISRTLIFLKKILLISDGGSILVAIWASFLELISEPESVRSYEPNASDKFAKTTGDIETFVDGKLVSAVDCKQRPLNGDDVFHGIKKAVEARISEYVFVYSQGIESQSDKTIRDAISINEGKLDILLIDIWDELPRVVRLLNPSQRSKFGDTIVNRLRKMRRFETANNIADIWNTTAPLTATY